MVLIREPADRGFPLWNHSTRMLESLTGVNWHSKWANEFSVSVRSAGVVMNSGGFPESSSGEVWPGTAPRPSSSAIFSIVRSIPFGSCDSNMILLLPAKQGKSHSWMSGTPSPSMSLSTFLLSDSPLHIIPNTLWGDCLPLFLSYKIWSTKWKYESASPQTKTKKQNPTVCSCRNSKLSEWIRSMYCV